MGMLNFQEMTNAQRAFLALRFLSDFGFNTLIARKDFDSWVIDSAMAAGPNGRAKARRELNNWAMRLRADDAFRVVVADDDNYRIVKWTPQPKGSRRTAVTLFTMPDVWGGEY